MKSNRKVLNLAKQRFEAWRRNPERGKRIPAELWQLAVAAAREHGVSRVATHLKVEYSSLHRHFKTATARNQAPVPDRMEFVEVPGNVLSGPDGGAIQIEDPNGIRLRVEWNGAPPRNLEEIAQTLWSSRA
jgi:hypothetical protein